MLGFINDDPAQPEPDQYDTIQAEASTINAAGGVDGHPVQVTHCSGELNTNATTACARQFASNPKIIATIGNFEAQGQGATAILDAAGLAQLGNYATLPPDYSCHTCFPYAADSLGGPLGATTAVIDVGHATKLAGIYIDIPAARSYPPLIEGVVKGSGRNVSFVKNIFVPPNDTNFQSVVAEIQSSGANGIYLAIPQQQAQAFMLAMAHAGSNIPIGVPMATTYTNILAQLPSSERKNLDVGSMFSRTGTAYPGLVKAQSAVTNKDNDEAFNGYIALQMFVNLVKGMPNPTRSSIVAAANKLTAYDTGATPPINFTATSNILGGAFKRLTNTMVYYYHFSNGKLSPAGSGNLVKAP
jgi:ABC-type branched-subunit amino acid transport system substrate-binding protein